MAANMFPSGEELQELYEYQNQHKEICKIPSAKLHKTNKM